MHLFHIPQCSIQNRNVHISVLNGALCDIEQVHSEICEIGLLLFCNISNRGIYMYFIIAMPTADFVWRAINVRICV